MRQGDFVERLPLSAAPKPAPLSLLYRRGKTFVVWDERGLTIRVGKTVRSTRLPEIAVSPRVFPREEIRANLALMEKGERKKDANALSGAKRIGNDVYLLVRWEDTKAKPWLEALVRVDLTDKNPKPHLLGRFDGLAVTERPIDDKLFLLGDNLAAITQRRDAWGLATFRPKDKSFDFLSIGNRLTQYVPQSETKALFLETTTYDTTLAGRVDLSTGARTTLAEDRGVARLIDAEDPPIATFGGPVARNLVTGAETPLPASAGLRRGKKGIIVWSPLKDPKRATLYDPTDWTVLATWK